MNNGFSENEFHSIDASNLFSTAQIKLGNLVEHVV